MKLTDRMNNLIARGKVNPSHGKPGPGLLQKGVKAVGKVLQSALDQPTVNAEAEAKKYRNNLLKNR